MFKLGASGREQLAAYLNGWIFLGFAAYGAGTILWIYSLSHAKLTLVYPFTALTFVLVYIFGVLCLREPTSIQALSGVALVLVGLFVISTA
jgi:undecaprenyl phosphate-alpha-L-ara4N flippase subunit ArnE